ncbi:HAD family hydrolase [Dongshaea marina]|uniref:hypothetical protein n=1 Tax=Dongshaea marina TaxID=2047966 RepID=UPI000D3EA474|nr:hypothetical protein [Dongshaea marina]
MARDHQQRLDEALSRPVKFFLFDIDHNLTDERGRVPESAIEKIAALVAEHGVGVGLVSGRPELSTLEDGPDITQVIRQLQQHLSEEQQQKLVIFPEYAGYGREVGSKRLHDYGFMGLFEKSLPLLLEMIEDNRDDQFDFLEIKKTSLSIWLKPPFHRRDTVDRQVESYRQAMSKIPLCSQLMVINGANRTIDILPRAVNKQRAIAETAAIYRISVDTIATSDDQGAKDDAGHAFTDHALGFATRDFDPESVRQISTRLCINQTGLEANLSLLERLQFTALES